MPDAVPASAYPAQSTTTSVETIGPDVIEVVIPFNEGTVAEAKAAALAIVSDLATDDIAGLNAALNDKATRADLSGAIADFEASTLVDALIFG